MLSAILPVTVSAIIPTRGKAALVRKCIDHLSRSVLPDGCTLDALIVEQGGEESKSDNGRGYGDSHRLPVRWAAAHDEWSYSQINNFGVPETAGKYVLLLNNDCFVEPGCIQHMLALMQSDRGIGVVGAKLLYEDGRLQHAGVYFGVDGRPGHAGYGSLDDGSVPFAEEDGSPDANTFACVLIRRECWNELEGLDPAYYFNYEDVDFCLRARERGWGMRFAHKARAIHVGGASADIRTTYDHSAARNFFVLRRRWIDSRRLDRVLQRSFDTARPTPVKRRGLLSRILTEAWRAVFRGR